VSWEPSLDELSARMRDLGAGKLLIKHLAANDNSKNQIYFGGGFDALNLIPIGEVQADGKRFKAPIDLRWMKEDQGYEIAPGAQMILYPQYPEVRFSGFLRGCSAAPSETLGSRDEGRVLVLGIADGHVFAAALTGDSRLASELGSPKVRARGTAVGVFEIFELGAGPARNSLTSLLEALGRVHQLGWIRGQRLRSDGSTAFTDAPNAGGFTLEAVLGVSANSDAAPDFMGWELKSMSIKKAGEVPVGKRLTLMTPEPRAGYYRDEGVIEFVRRFGYPDLKGKADRLNFGGQFRVGETNARTGLRLELDGYSLPPGTTEGKITDPSGGLVLRDPETGLDAATWHFRDLMEHWNRKHALAAYVPAEVRKGKFREFRYGQTVFLGQQTDFLRFLGALALGRVVYDPGIKVEENSSGKPKEKRRSQFRISFGNLDSLYDKFSAESVIRSQD
jgi:hypothetical protein